MSYRYYTEAGYGKRIAACLVDAFICIFIAGMLFLGSYKDKNSFFNSFFTYVYSPNFELFANLM